jgi:putative drug exporter of the RND superfamily
MFRILGKTVSRIWPLLLVAWIAALVGTKLAAPPWNQVAQDKEFAFLPDDAPSRQAEKLLHQAFPDDKAQSNIVLVGHHDAGGPVGLDTDKKFIDDVLEPALRRIADEEGGLASEVRSTDSSSPFTNEWDKPEAPRKLAFYASDMGGRAKIATRLDLVLEENPFSRAAMQHLQKVQEVFQASLPSEIRDAEVRFSGPTASLRDVQSVTHGDQVRIEILVLGSVFLILLILLRRLTVSLYLLLSVLFSYYTTLGVVFAVFWALDPAGFAGIDWKVGIFLFTILIAVGEDYNIFLMTRIAEEQEGHGPVRGIIEAFARTGPIISSCGIIMAGTFGSLMAGSLGEMRQLGFALAFGVLLDTFVVRPILVPTFLLWLHTGKLHVTGFHPDEPAMPGPAAPGPRRRDRTVER